MDTKCDGEFHLNGCTTRQSDTRKQASTDENGKKCASITPCEKNSVSKKKKPARKKKMADYVAGFWITFVLLLLAVAGLIWAIVALMAKDDEAIQLCPARQDEKVNLRTQPKCEICSGHGAKQNDKCVCSDGYAGRYCENCAKDFVKDQTGACVEGL